MAAKRMVRTLVNPIPEFFTVLSLTCFHAASFMEKPANRKNNPTETPTMAGGRLQIQHHGKERQLLLGKPLGNCAL